LRVEAFHSSILDLEVDGASESVLLRDVQWHPYKRLVMHIDFQRVQGNEKVTLSVPLHFVNQEQSPAIKVQHAVISHVLTEIEVTCLPADLPEYIEVDMSGMSVEHSVHISNLNLPKGVQSTALMHDQDPVVATATVKGGASGGDAAGEGGDGSGDEEA
jgi:large subunit ribosomal protein L25